MVPLYDREVIESGCPSLLFKYSEIYNIDSQYNIKYDNKSFNILLHLPSKLLAIFLRAHQDRCCILQFVLLFIVGIKMKPFDKIHNDKKTGEFKLYDTQLIKGYKNIEIKHFFNHIVITQIIFSEKSLFSQTKIKYFLSK